jgi:hypothetical protein
MEPRGSKASRRASPNSAKLKTVMVKARPGKTVRVRLMTASTARISEALLPLK